MRLKQSASNHVLIFLHQISEEDAKNQFTSMEREKLSKNTISLDLKYIDTDPAMPPDAARTTVAADLIENILDYFLEEN